VKVTVELDEEQVYVINNALELYCRICMGQLDMLTWLTGRWGTTQQVRDDIAQLKRDMFPELAWNASWGIAQDQSGEWAHIAWDIHTTLRHDISWKKYPEGGNTVNFHKPMHICTKHPLPKVTIVD
jgi:hypothetical protein